MKKNRETTLRIMWYLSIGLTLACSSVLAPGAYILTIGLLVCLALVLGIGFAVFILLDSGPLGWLVARDVIEGGLQLVGAIFLAFLSASGNE
jgi:uncharacterized membrane protein